MELQGRVDIFPARPPWCSANGKNKTGRPLLELDADTKQRGRDYLAALGMPRDGWFVAMHIRENGYKTRARSTTAVSATPTSTGICRPFGRIVDQGGWVIRCGDAKMRPLPKMDHVFDYAFSPERRDWLDIFFASQCRFMIGTQSGLSHVADTFGVPTLYTNWVCWGFPPWYGTNVFLPKTFWSRPHGRALTVPEILEAKLGCCENPDVFDARRLNSSTTRHRTWRPASPRCCRRRTAAHGGRARLRRICGGNWLNWMWFSAVEWRTLSWPDI